MIKFLKTATELPTVLSAAISVLLIGSGSLSHAIAATPAIKSFNPQFAIVGAAATKITFTGSNLTGVSSLVWNGFTFSTISSTSTTATGTVPASALKLPASAPIVFKSAAGMATSSSLFTVYGKPTISKSSPASGPVGTEITITGTNLGGATAVTFTGGATVAPVSAAGTSLIVVVPTAAKTGTIMITTPGGKATTATVFTVVFPPTVTSFTPTSVKANSGAVRIAITGTDLIGVSSIIWNGHALTSVAVNGSTSAAGTIAASFLTTPASAPITVANSAGAATSKSDFTVFGAPSITSLSPTSVLSGSSATTVTVKGANLDGATSLTWNGHSLTGLVASGTTTLTGTIAAASLTSPASAPIIVTTSGGRAVSTADFSVLGRPTITSLNPTSGAAGSTITVTGSNLIGANLVTFTLGATAVPTSVTANSFRVVVPFEAQNGPIKVTTPVGTAQSTQSYTITSGGGPPPPPL